MVRKVAVVLLNLGGPDSLESVEGFLYSMFSDRYIVDIQVIARLAFAKVISKLRARSTRKIYEIMGGKSVLLEETTRQAACLEERLNNNPESVNVEYRVFVCMRHSAPRATEVLCKTHSFNPDKVVLLPLYPQYSCATTQSAIQDWYSGAYELGYVFDTDIVWSYHDHDTYIDSCCRLILDKYEHALSISNRPRVLFSAHSLPVSFIKKGDPYQQQIIKTVDLLIKKMCVPSLDYVICYQSKVGPVRWLEPSTKSEIIRAHIDDVPVVVAPIAFVSENSETLVELDIEYKAIMKQKRFFRVPTVGTEKRFTECLYDLVTQKLQVGT
ncbi:MAG: ferrochelatase [Aaplasma endosymbiont of Hyalomma asiaticum]